MDFVKFMDPTLLNMGWFGEKHPYGHPIRKKIFRFSSKDGRPKGMDVGDGVGPLPKKVPMVSTWGWLGSSYRL